MLCRATGWPQGALHGAEQLPGVVDPTAPHHPPYAPGGPDVPEGVAVDDDEVGQLAQKAMLAVAKKHPQYRLVKSCPGLGPVRTAQLLSIVVTPFLFQCKQGFWKYCGLGIVERSSSDWVRTRTGQWVRAEVKRTSAQ